MKKLFLFVAVMMTAVVFSSCSKDEDEIPTIIGTWQITHSEGYAEYSDGTRDDFYEDYPDKYDGFYWTYTFNNDGTFVEQQLVVGKPTTSTPYDYATYSLSGNTLSITNITGRTTIFEIKELTDSQLILYEQAEEAHQKYEHTYIYKRIK